MNVADHGWGCGASLFSEAMVSRMNDDDASVSVCLVAGQSAIDVELGLWRYHLEAWRGLG
jgi:hypothetical protein